MLAQSPSRACPSAPPPTPNPVGRQAGAPALAITIITSFYSSRSLSGSVSFTL